jgi:hypothetical protein
MTDVRFHNVEWLKKSDILGRRQMTGVSVELGCRPDLQGKKWEENQGHAGKI